MEDIFIKIAAGSISTLGFAILFRLKPSHWAFAVFDGLLACVCYFAFKSVFDGDFLPNLLAVFVASSFAELFARLCKAPSTVFILPGCIALVPGGTLYFAMSNLLSENREQALVFSDHLNRGDCHRRRYYCLHSFESYSQRSCQKNKRC